MESEFLTFEAGDVEFIGDVIEFDEDVQRGEKVRFYTLNEQVNDAFDHMMPKGRATRAQLKKLGKEVDRVRELYETYVSPVSDGYSVVEPVTLRSFSWIQPVTDAKGFTTYDYDTEWKPLFEPDAIGQPNGYPRMLTALPSPHAADQGIPFPLTEATEFTDSEGKMTQMRALPEFKMNKTRRHEDGRLDIISVPVQGTGDPATFIGYWLKARELPIPDPLPEHDFLSSNEAKFIPKAQPLADIVPRLDAVMMHGVPVTQDPYGEGKKFLKVYDIKLEAIPWELWKQRFPKKEVVDVPPPAIELGLPMDAPKEPTRTPPNVVTSYKSQRFPSISDGKWLMSQVDGGHLVIKMYQSLAGDAGTTDMLPVAELGDLRFPDVDPSQCGLTGLTFQEFAVNGVIRQWELPKNMYTRKCIPLEIVEQERHQVGYRNRIQWKESTPKDIINEYTRALAAYQAPPVVEKEIAYAKQGVRPQSQIRTQVIAILEDEERFPEDKFKDIQVLIRGGHQTGQQVVDQEGRFVVCGHTLALLSGDMIKDRLAFYDKWTARDDGFRVCKVCGEQVNNDVLVHQEDFSEEGRLLKHADALETKTFHGAATANYTTSLATMQEYFDLEDPSDGTLFLLISLLQLLPSQDQVLPVLQEARSISGAIKAKDKDGKARGMIGIAAAVLLIQTHLPRLVPRRSFGSLPLKMDGFPRDTDSDKAPTVIDSLLIVLRKTFEAYPTSFKGPSVSVMRAVLSDSSSVRKGVISILKKMMPKFGAALARAKTEADANPAPAPVVGLIPVMLPPEKLGVITSFPLCGGPRSMWADPQTPTIRQPAVPLDRIRPRPSTVSMPRIIVTPVQLEKPAPEDIRRRLKIAAVPKTGGDSWRTNLLIAQRLSNAFQLGFDIETIDITQSADLLRDVADGIVREMISGIVKDPVMRRAYEELREKDIALFAMLASLKDAKTETNTLKAKERHLFTDRMREMTDSQRQITKDLLDRGMAPYIITKKDRDTFAAQLEKEIEPLMEADLPVVDGDAGVGAPRDAPDDDDRNADEGDYGDHLAQGNRDRDQDTDAPDARGPI